jgi:hypothetical protein
VWLFLRSVGLEFGAVASEFKDRIVMGWRVGSSVIAIASV